MSTDSCSTNRESDGARAWKENFRINIECTRCGADFMCDSPVVGVDKWPGRHMRAVVVYAPESCPECKSLHLTPSHSTSESDHPLGSPPPESA